MSTYVKLDIIKSIDLTANQHPSNRFTVTFPHSIYKYMMGFFAKLAALSFIAAKAVFVFSTFFGIIE